MKKYFFIIAMIVLCTLPGCAQNNGKGKENQNQTKEENMKNILVTYFSCTGNTRSLAEQIANTLKADLYEIKPQVPYSSADLNWRNSSSRATIEQNDSSSRPAISGNVDNLKRYDIVFLGYPIWFGQAPKIIYTFLESYDFSNKMIVPFCTSGSSPIGTSATNLHRLCSNNTTWLSGSRFSHNASHSEITTWINGLGLNINTGEAKNKIMYLYIGNKVLSATLIDNSSTKALINLLAEKDIVINMKDYGNFEKVGSLNTNLPQNNEQITTQSGDIILYQGNQFVIYYDHNSWSFTRLGKINNISQQELKTILGTGDVTVRLSINQ